MLKGHFISYLKGTKLVSKGFINHLIWDNDSSVKVPFLHTISIVKEFPEVFADNLPSVPPESEIDFGTDIIPDTLPISILPHRMAPAELKELKE